MADSVSFERFERLLDDESIPVVHRALWLLLWQSDVRVLDLLALEVTDVERIRPVAAGAESELGERADALLGRLVGDRATGPLFAVGSRALSWDEAVRVAKEHGHAIHAFRTSGRRHR
ncbi:hypothetical protein [Streptomyces radicis]|nr:hypothetical protein [Streptomyces radicis]